MSFSLRCSDCSKIKLSCHVCRKRHESKCARCCIKYTLINEDTAICIDCKCTECDSAKRKCCTNCGVTLDTHTCLEHHPNLGRCNYCKKTCEMCGYEGLLVLRHPMPTLDRFIWQHECGIFCNTCVSVVTIDVSPITLAKLHDLKGAFNYKKGTHYKCEKCLNGRTIEEYQRGLQQPHPMFIQ